MTIRLFSLLIWVLFCTWFPQVLFADRLVGAESTPARTEAISHNPQSSDIFAYPPDYYAVQIVAVKTKPQVVDLLKRYDLGDPPYGLMKTDTGFWYVLLLGVYPNYERAVDARDKLPPELLKLKPWVRKMGPLQAAISAAYPSTQ